MKKDLFTNPDILKIWDYLFNPTHPFSVSYFNDSDELIKSYIEVIYVRALRDLNHSIGKCTFPGKDGKPIKIELSKEETREIIISYMINKINRYTP